MIRLRARNIVQQELGALRSLASRMHYEDKQIDEEEAFKIMLANWMKGIRTEVSKIVGIEEWMSLS